MSMFNKPLKFKIIALIVSISFCLTSTVFPYPSQDALRVPVHPDSYERLIGAMHDVNNGGDPAQRLNALKRLLRMKGLDIEVWSNEQVERMTDNDRNAIRRALRAIDPNITDVRIEYFVNKIVLCDVPRDIGLEKTKGIDRSRIGAVIIATKDGYKILFPKDRIWNINNKIYMADLLHELVELGLIENNIQDIDGAHKIAINARNEFLAKGTYAIPVFSKMAQDAEFIEEPVVMIAMHERVDDDKEQESLRQQIALAKRQIQQTTENIASLSDPSKLQAERIKLALQRRVKVLEEVLNKKIGYSAKEGEKISEYLNFEIPVEELTLETLDLVEKFIRKQIEQNQSLEDFYKDFLIRVANDRKFLDNFNNPDWLRKEIASLENKLVRLTEEGSEIDAIKKGKGTLQAQIERYKKKLSELTMESRIASLDKKLLLLAQGKLTHKLTGETVSGTSAETMKNALLEQRELFQSKLDKIKNSEPIVGAMHERVEDDREKEEIGSDTEKRLPQLEALKDRIENNQFRRVAMFGDQHGQNSVLNRIIGAVENGQVDEVIGHGDCFDRGNENIRNFEALKKLKNMLGNRANFCFGNHDVWLIQALLLGDRIVAENWIRQGGKELLEEFRNGGIEPRELALWMLQNFKLFHIDERGFMHLHAGIPADDEGNPLISREQLEKWQNELEGIQLEMARDPRFMERAQNNIRVARLFEEAEDIFWVRMGAWVNKFAPKIVIDDANREKLYRMLRQNGLQEAEIVQIWEKVLIQQGNLLRGMGIQFKILDAPEVDRVKMDRFLAGLGVNGIVFGHEWQDRLMNLDNRIFCIDVHKGDNGFLVFNGDGIRFNALARSDEDLIASRSAILAGIDEEIIRLKQGVGESVVEEEEALAFHKDNIHQEEVIAKERISESRQNDIRYPKDTMRRLRQALRISWGDGAFELLARESTQFPGAIRVHDIKVAGQEMGVIYREGGRLVRGDSLLIRENQELRIGRDRTTGTYSFIAGDRVFDFGRVQGQRLLVQREGSFMEEDFSLSRRVSNLPIEISVEISEGATSSTEIKSVFMVSNVDDLMQVVKEMAKLAEYKEAATVQEEVDKGIRATKVNIAGEIKTHLSDLQQRRDVAGFHRTLKLLRAVLENDHTVLLQRGQMSDGRIGDTIDRLEELTSSNLSVENLTSIVVSAGRQDDYSSVIKDLTTLSEEQGRGKSEDSFIIGRVNSTESIGKVTHIGSRSMEDIEKLSRPGVLVESGLIGHDESLRELLIEDNDYVVNQGYTHQQLARWLNDAMQRGFESEERKLDTVYNEKLGRDTSRLFYYFKYNGMRFRMRDDSFMGGIESPFDGEITGFSIIAMENLDKGISIIFSSALVGFIEKFGFYEGKQLQTAEEIVEDAENKSERWAFSYLHLHRLYKKMMRNLQTSTFRLPPQAIIAMFDPNYEIKTSQLADTTIVKAPEDEWQTEEGIHNFMQRMYSNRKEFDTHFGNLTELKQSGKGTYGGVIRAIGFFTQFSRNGLISDTADLDGLVQTAEKLRSQIGDLIMVFNDNYTYTDKRLWIDLNSLLEIALRVCHSQRDAFVNRVQQRPVVISIIKDGIVGAMHERISPARTKAIFQSL